MPKPNREPKPGSGDWLKNIELTVLRLASLIFLILLLLRLLKHDLENW